MATNPRDDELASAYLDGEATAEERLRVEADPALLARVDALSAVRDAIRTEVVPVPAEARDWAIAAAIAAAASPRRGPTDELAEVRARRSGRDTRWIKIAGIAAAVLLAVASIPLLSRIGDSSKRESTAALSAKDSEKSSAGAGTGGSGPGPMAATEFTGDFASAEDLATQVATRFSSNTAAPTTTVDAPPAGSAGGAEVGTTSADAASPRQCAAPPAEMAAQSHAVFTTSATIRGAPVAVTVYERPDGARLLVITDQACAVLLSRRL